MTAPIWMASPPELHSALLSTGPGPGPLLASAEAWQSVSVAYAETASDLTALLAQVETAAWHGPTSLAYVAAHLPYLGWLVQAGADSAAMATQQQTVAAAYTTALAAMPTLAELAANHATHAVLLATNFFGINTIAIALNEADYLRMWIQAATVMAVYQVISNAAMLVAPGTTLPPEITKANEQATAIAQSLPLPADQQNDFLQWLQNIGYLDFYDKYIQPLINALSNLPFFQAMFSGFDPYLVILGNPLTYFSPFNIAFALGYPMDIGTYVALLSQMMFYVGLDLTAAFASGNPATIGFTILFVTVEIIGTVVTDTIALLKTLLEQTLVLITVLVPLLTTPLIPLAAGVVLAPIGLKGLAALAALPPPALPGAPPPPPPVLALAPTASTSTAPAPAPAEVTAPAPAPSAPVPPSAAPPTLTGTGIGLGMDNYGYLVGNLSSSAKRQAANAARKKAPVPDEAEAAAAAAIPHEQAPTPRRRRAKAKLLGRGYEYMDPEPIAEATTATASDAGAGTMGFTDTAHKPGAAAAGLVTLADDPLDDAPRQPMMPSTWRTNG
ncbi:PPE family protein [Mycobacterium vicinigordonae]|uniref:PPE family protein n=1 Tax=Mycobacterium vicinigordonae TaxID=1719132 RepID=A0A7D6E479_9MYCO|nr:PPE family protein [Mycobacterium vicinigordonae]QLL05065.1 PPE family protein [Mycobacterium vicinigordonae]